MLIEEITVPKLPKRSKYGVGKSMVGHIYVHAKYMNDVIPDDLLQRGLTMANNFPFTILKFNPKTGYISFIESPDFNSSPEPIVGRSLLVKPDSDSSKIINPPADPWIYHHKWLMVKDDYSGFNVEESKNRSRKWMSLKPDTSRIGKLSYWMNNVVPYIK